jgi:hypothetical protein
MAADDLDPGLGRLLEGLRELQNEFGEPVADVAVEAPQLAVASLQQAVDDAPRDYREYLEEALECYLNGLFRAAVLMVWAAVMEHLYMTASAHSGGLAAFEEANKARFGTAKSYRRLKQRDDFLYLRDRDYIQLGEDAGMFNKNARKMLWTRLDLRNDCGHPTKYQPGREETVIFIESLLLNIVSGRQLNW